MNANLSQQSRSVRVTLATCFLALVIAGCGSGVGTGGTGGGSGNIIPGGVGTDLPEGVTPHAVIANSIVYKITAISPSPGGTYTESLALSDTTMSISRTGDAYVNVGAWSDTLSQDEISTINTLITQATRPDIVDDIHVAVTDVPLIEIRIGDSKIFYQGSVINGASIENHQLPQEALNLAQFIDSLINKYGHAR